MRLINNHIHPIGYRSKSISISIYIFYCFIGVGHEVYSQDVTTTKDTYKYLAISTYWDKRNDLFEQSAFKNSVIDNKIEMMLRLYIVPTFHHPVCYTAFLKNKMLTMTYKQLDGHGGYEWGHLMFQKTIYNLDKKISNDVIKLITDEAYWAPFEPYHLSLMSGGMDGESWLIEAWDGKKFAQILLENPLFLKDDEHESAIIRGKMYEEFRKILESCFVGYK